MREVRGSQPEEAPPGARSLVPPQGCGHQSAGHRGVAGWGEARLPGLPLGTRSVGAGAAAGATAGGAGLKDMSREAMEGRRCPKFAKYKIWGPITNLGPVSESKKRSGKTRQNPVAHFFRGPLSGS